MLYSELVKKAMNISFNAHKNDYDKNGYPYFLHPLVVAYDFEDEDLVCTALLHDVVEDKGYIYSFEYLKESGFNDNIITALKLLTKPKGMDYLTYINNLKNNPLAKKVKLADLKHNTDLTRGIKPPKYELYLKAIKILKE